MNTEQVFQSVVPVNLLRNGLSAKVWWRITVNSRKTSAVEKLTMSIVTNSRNETAFESIDTAYLHRDPPAPNRLLRRQRPHRWFSGRMLACHAGGPGSIPGRCILTQLSATQKTALASVHKAGPPINFLSAVNCRAANSRHRPPVGRGRSSSAASAAWWWISQLT